MSINFENIVYLKHGNKKQKEVYNLLINNKILYKLNKFRPIVVGTIPINIDIEKSDIDIICYYENKDFFIKTLNKEFINQNRFTINEKNKSDSSYIVSIFFINNFKIEIFAQNIPTKEQLAYKHLILEYKLLKKYGKKFRKKIIDLKKKGYKTEPAFASILEIKGNPYFELLNFYNNSLTK